MIPQPMEALTALQQRVLDYLRSYHAEFDCLPSSRQITKHFSRTSQTTGMNHLIALTKKGYLESITDPSTRRTFYRFARPVVGTRCAASDSKL